jgi:hypothetical protein
MTKPTPALGMIMQPDYWPNWPILPVVRLDRDDSKGEDCGFLFCLGGDPEPVVYHCNMLMLGDLAFRIKHDTGQAGVTWGQMLAEIPSRRFASFDELLAEYRVD